MRGFVIFQVFDAGDVFGIMQVEEAEEEEENSEQEHGKKSNPVDEIVYKVIVTSESGLQVSDPTR